MAWLCGLEPAVSAVLAALTGVSFGIIAWAEGQRPARVEKRRPAIASVLLVAPISTAGLITGTLETDKPYRMLTFLFFLCGINVGAAFAVTSYWVGSDQKSEERALKSVSDGNR